MTLRSVSFPYVINGFGLWDVDAVSTLLERKFPSACVRITSQALFTPCRVITTAHRDHADGLDSDYTTGGDITS